MYTTGIYNEIQAALRRGERVVIATVVKAIGAAPCGVGGKMLIHADGTGNGSFGGAPTDTRVIQEALHALHEGHSYVAHIHLDADRDEAVGSCGATLEVFFEVALPEPRLIIAGAGYVAQALARLAEPLDFRITVIDDRRDLANPQLFGKHVQLTFGDIPQSIHKMEPDASSWIVIVTRGHHLDKDTLRASLETSAAYVGMIGSPSKVRHIFQDLQKEGVTRKQLERIHAPIGLNLGAETPDEIALSIAAEILMLRKKGTGAPLHTIHTLLDEEAGSTQ